MLRHERQTVAVELTAALHPSRDARWDVAHEALRGQKTASSGMRPAPPEEVSEPQVWAVTVGCVACPGALVSSPMLAGGDATDDVTVAFLVAAALEEKKDEEEKARVRRQREAAEHEARMQELDRRVQDDVPLSQAESRAWMRWAGHLPSQEEEEEEEEGTSSQLFTSSLGCPASWSVWTRRTFLPRHRDRFRCPRCTQLETWTFYEPLVSGTLLFGACHRKF